MEKDKKIIGQEGENKAAVFLRELGYKIITTNFRTKLGEIDIIAKDNDELVIIEVKTRKTNYFGEPEEFVTGRKQQRIRRAALEYLSQNPHSNWRIDIVSITNSPETINHFKNITL